MLVLLIVFMVTAPLLTQGIKVDLPKARAEQIADASNQAPIILSVDASGNLFINVGDDEDKPQNAQSIIDRTRAVLNSQPSTMVLVKADRSVAYGNVVGAMVSSNTESGLSVTYDDTNGRMNMSHAHKHEHAHKLSLGKMLIFPSTLAHFVNTNTEDSTRHTLSFNMMPRTVYADPTVRFENWHKNNGAPH